MKSWLHQWMRGRRAAALRSSRHGRGWAALRKFFQPVVESLEDRTLPNAISWISSSSGFWDVASNWSTGQVPTGADNVTINQPGVTVTVQDAEAAGTLSGSDALAIVSGGLLNIGAASMFGGDVSLAAGGALTVAASTTLNGHLNNAGTLNVGAGTLTVSGPVSQVSGTSLTGGAWNVANGATLNLASAPNLTTNAATVSLSGTANFPQLASITIDSGSLSLQNGANFSAGGDFTISGSLSDDTGQFNLNNHQLTISNGGTLSLGNASGLTGASQITNAGTFQVSAGTGTMTLGAFNNQGGTIDVESGTLQTQGGTSTGGTFLVKPQAVYESGANGATAIWTGTYTGSGGGFPNFLGNYTGTYTGSGVGTVALSSLTLNIGVGGVSFNLPGNLFQWTGGNINSAVGDLTNLGTITFAGSSDKMFFNDGTLDNQGTIIQTGSGNLGLHSDNQFPTTFKIEPGALYLIQGDSGIDNPSGGQTAVINVGTIQKTVGTGTSTLFVNGSLSNTGTIEADIGTVSLSATISQLSGTILTAGTWKALNGATLALPGGSTIATNQATITLSGAGATLGGLGALAANAGTLTFTNGAGLTTAGNLANTSALALGPGSKLTVHGTYTQGAAATLQVQLGGTPATGQFGQLSAAGAATLGGTLQVLLTNGYAPAAGDRFQVVTFASATGTFAAINNPLFHGGNLFQVQTNLTNITVTAATVVSDLALISSTLRTSSAQPGQAVTVNYQGQNLGQATPVSGWIDSIFLTTGTALDASAVLLGHVTHTGVVAANGQYAGTLTAPLPLLLPGTYHVLVEVDSRGLSKYAKII